MNKIIVAGSLFLSAMVTVNAQNSKVQNAFRALNDYNSSKDVDMLKKAKENIDAACEHPDTKEKAKTWVYRANVYLALFKNNLDAESKKLGDISDKNERMEKAYGNVSTADYEEAGKSLEKAQALDKDKVYQMEMAMAGMGMMGEINNLAVGKYQAKKYDEAMEFFEGNYEISKAMGKKDTSNIFNAMISAQKANNYEKTKYYADKMISDKVANASAYQFLFDANIALKDTNAAKAALSKGRAAFPNNTYLMNRETEFYLQSGKQEEALANLNSSILKDPSNSQLYLVRGNVYDNLANPKDANRKDLEKPKNYEELVGKAEADYLKSSELNGALFDTWYNLGALYNNWGAYYQAKADAISKSGPEQKAFQTKADTYFGKAIPQLEKALELNSKDKATMFALRKLYMLTNQPDKAAKMSEAMKK